jgi:hypothetical protein
MFRSNHPHYDYIERASIVQDRNSVHLYKYVKYYNAFYKKSVLSEAESGSELLYDWRFTANQFVLATSPLRPTTSNFISQLNTCGHRLYVTSSLTRRWVCPLELLLVSPAQFFSGPSPSRLMTTFYCLRFETPRTRWARSLYLYRPGTGWTSYTTRHWVPFWSPTTRSATVEVFDPASIRDSSSRF